MRCAPGPDAILDIQARGCLEGTAKISPVCLIPGNSRLIVSFSRLSVLSASRVRAGFLMGEARPIGDPDLWTPRMTRSPCWQVIPTKLSLVQFEQCVLPFLSRGPAWTAPAAGLAQDLQRHPARDVSVSTCRYFPSESDRSSAATPAGRSTLTPKSTIVRPSACTVRNRLCSRHCSPI